MQRKPNRYELPMMTIVAAMLVTLVVVIGFVLVRGALRTNEPTQVPTVEYSHLLQSGKEDGKLLMLSPQPMPSGWRATSAQYRGGAGPTWHLGILTSDGKYVGIDEARSSVGDLVAKVVREPEQGEPVEIDGTTWQSWRGETGDYALTRAEEDVAIVVRGTTAATVVQGFVKRLKPA